MKQDWTDLLEMKVQVALNVEINVFLFIWP